MERPYVDIPSLDFDLFFSYSTRDDLNESVHPDRKGRVSAFVQLLLPCLKRLVGNFTHWIDQARLDGQFLLRPGIETPLQRTAIMVAFLSRGYHESDWCPWERKVFLEAAPVRGDGRSRVFVVEFDCVENAWRPKEFEGIRAFRFWKQGNLDPHPRIFDPYDQELETEYRGQIDGMARAILETLTVLKQPDPPPRLQGPAIVTQQQQQPPQSAAPKGPMATVYLAEVTDDLEPTWRQVKTYLEQQNIVVVPREVLPLDPEAFRKAVESNLADADLFVQLLGLAPGRKVNEQQTYLSHQCVSARAAGLPIMQWRDELLKEPETEAERAVAVPDPTHRALLYGPQVQAVKYGEFTQNILQTLERLREDAERQKSLQQQREQFAAGKNKGKYIFVLADKKDKSLAEKIYDFLDEQGFPCGLPITLEDADVPPDSAAIRKDYENNVLLADGTVVVFGDAAPAWYRSQLFEVRSIQIEHAKARRQAELGLYVRPPRPVRLNLPGLHKILTEADVDEKAFRPFLDAIVKTPVGESVLA